ncbi:MAG: hypothetical protein ACLTMP_10285 [Eggerthella lenta]
MNGWLGKSKICFMKGEAGEDDQNSNRRLDRAVAQFDQVADERVRSFAGSSGASNSLLFSAMIVLYR